MKVAFASPSWPYGQNGVISYTRSISRAMHELGHEVSILTFDANGSLGYETVVPLKFPRQSMLRRLARGIAHRVMPNPAIQEINPVAEALIAAVSDLQKRNKIDIVEMEESFGWCGVVADRTVVPVVARLHGPYFLTGVYDEAPGVVLDPRRLRGEGECVDKVAALTAPSRQVLEATRAYYGRSRDAHVIPNPIPIDEMDRIWSVAQCDPDAILFVGRTDNRKGGDLVIRSFVELASRRPRLKLHFVGPDKGFVDSLPGETVPDYIRRIVPPEIQSRIFVHGALAPSEISQLRLTARVTVMASRYENFPMAALEALAAGCPLVTTAVGGMAEVVTDGVTGLLCESESSGELAAKVSLLLDDDDLSARLGSAGRQACVNRFHPKVVARETLAVYSTAISSKRTTGAA